MNELDTLIDLAAERVGGRALVASDEFFAPKENLLRPGRGVFIEDRYTEFGKWMDGWETRRKRGPGHDWCIVRLGLPGAIEAVTVDTNHFRGNHPEACSLDGCTMAPGIDPARLPELDEAWTEVLARSPVEGHSENRFAIDRAEHPERVTHVRLNIYPDGGVARLRVWGRVLPDWEALAAAGPVDLVSIEHGGRPLSSSDRFFSEPINLIMPGRASSMKDGWETRRRRGEGHDWTVVALGRRGVIERVVLDTAHFKGNFPESASLEACDVAAGVSSDLPPSEAAEWHELVPRARLQADREHVFDVAGARPATHVRLNIFPDGGVSRLRLWGRPVTPG